MSEKNGRKVITILTVILLIVLFAVGMIAVYRYFFDDLIADKGNDNYVVRDEEVDFSKLTYVALGDSITYAMDGTKGGARMEKPYCEVVKDSLKLKAVYNRGISGSTISAGTGNYEPFCNRFASMEKADIVSVMGGTNDWARGADLGVFGDIRPDTFYGALNILCKGLKAKYLHAFIFFMTPVKCLRYNGKTEGWEFDKYRTAIWDVCKKFDIPVLDTKVLADFSSEYYAEGYSGDGLHPSQAFHQNVLAPVIVDFIKENYKG